MSASVTVAISIITVPASIVTINVSPLSVGTSMPSDKSVDNTFPECTWCNNTAVNAGISSNNPCKAPSGSASNASSVGAKTVNGPSPLSVSTKSAVSSAVSKVE